MDISNIHYLPLPALDCHELANWQVIGSYGYTAKGHQYQAAGVASLRGASSPKDNPAPCQGALSGARRAFHTGKPNGCFCPRGNTPHSPSPCMLSDPAKGEISRPGTALRFHRRPIMDPSREHRSHKLLLGIKIDQISAQVLPVSRPVSVTGSSRGIIRHDRHAASLRGITGRSITCAAARASAAFTCLCSSRAPRASGAAPQPAARRRARQRLFSSRPPARSKAEQGQRDRERESDKLGTMVESLAPLPPGSVGRNETALRLRRLPLRLLGLPVAATAPRAPTRRRPPPSRRGFRLGVRQTSHRRNLASAAGRATRGASHHSPAGEQPRGAMAANGMMSPVTEQHHRDPC